MAVKPADTAGASQGWDRSCVSTRLSPTLRDIPTPSSRKAVPAKSKQRSAGQLPKSSLWHRPQLWAPCVSLSPDPFLGITSLRLRAKLNLLGPGYMGFLVSFLEFLLKFETLPK